MGSDNCSLMQPQGQHSTLSNMLSTYLHMHEATDVHEWLAVIDRGERVCYSCSPESTGQFCSLELLAGHDLLLYYWDLNWLHSDEKILIFILTRIITFPSVKLTNPVYYNYYYCLLSEDRKSTIPKH